MKKLTLKRFLKWCPLILSYSGVFLWYKILSYRKITKKMKATKKITDNQIGFMVFKKQKSHEHEYESFQFKWTKWVEGEEHDLTCWLPSAIDLMPISLSAYYFLLFRCLAVIIDNVYNLLWSVLIVNTYCNLLFLLLVYLMCSFQRIDRVTHVLHIWITKPWNSRNPALVYVGDSQNIEGR